MATEQQLAVAKEYFDSNPSEGVLHISTDGQVFFQKNYNDGAGHQRRIDPAQKMTTIFRKDVEPATSPTKDKDELPTDKWTNAKIAEWLTANNAALTGKENKAQLMALVAELAAKASSDQGANGTDDNSDEDNE